MRIHTTIPPGARIRNASGGDLLRPTGMSKGHRQIADVWRLMLFLSMCGLASAQIQNPATSAKCAPENVKQGTAATSCAPPKSSGVSEQFPYPGETQPDTIPSSPTVTPSGSSPAKDRFPYPGEPAVPDSADAAAPKAGSGESSSSSSGNVPPDADGKPDLKDEGSTGSTARGRRRLRPPAQKILSDDERVEEDLSVAHFYRQSGNLTGAYLRTKDAVKIQPQAADAHLALAEVAEKLGKRDEAAAEYSKYLELEPDGDSVKTAKKALEKLQP